MSIEADLRAKQIEAMKAKDVPTSNAIKMIKTKVMERRTAKGFTGEVDDSLYIDVITAYKKSLEKGRIEFEKAGDRGAAAIAELDHEIAFCQTFLPKPMTQDEADAAVTAAIAEIGQVTEKMAGRIVGAVMKANQNADAKLVRAAVDRALAKL